MLLTAILLASCSSTSRLERDQRIMEKMRSLTTLDIPKSSSVQLGQDVEYLANDVLQGRDTGSDGIEKAAQFLENRFKRLGIKPFYETYRDNFKVGDKEAFNVVAMMPGSDGNLNKEIVVIGAHYDHIGMIPTDSEDQIANGANDNATGTATVISIAQIMKNVDFNRRTIVFALFSAEEKGLVGSKHLAQRMKDDGHNVVAMINFEMTGVPMKDQSYIAYLTGYDTSNMGAIFNQENKKITATGKLDKAAEFNLFQRSDNYPFYEIFNVPAQTFCTFDFTNFDHYHKVGDEAQLMNPRHMADVVDALTPGILNVVNKNELQLTPKTDE